MTPPRSAGPLPDADWASADPLAQRLVPEWFARKRSVFPLRFDHAHLVVAALRGDDLELERDLAFASGRDVAFELATADEIASAFRAGYIGAETSDPGEATVASAAVQALVRAGDDSPVAKLVASILNEALDLRASDLHIEPMPSGGVVRVRVDGVLRRFCELPAELYPRVISRLKVQGGLDIADRLRPQDGRATHRRAGRADVELRISVIPAREGEKLVLRFLDPSNARSLEEIGLLQPEREALQRLIEHQDGIVVLTGPTGSGKTTTLYALLGRLDTKHVNVCTVEDPIEYALEGAIQVQVHEARGVTFANTLRSFLRQDPDVILVGEVRDAETAQVATQAATTGHLVLTTLHTNDAVGALPRLRDLGVDASVLADALRGVVAQRLVRRLCEQCAVAAPAERSAADDVLVRRYGVREARVKVGCDACARSGFRGRTAITEVLELTGEVRAAVQSGQPLATVRALAHAKGMRSLLDVARELVRTGVTTLDEVHRVLGQTELLSGAAVEGGALAAPQGAAAKATRSILIADHDADDLMAFEQHFSAQGWLVSTAIDGDEALGLMRTQSFDLAVLRLRLPKVSGREILAQLRSGSTAGLPIVITTNVSSGELEEQLLESGADDYVRKPITPKALEFRCQAVLRRRAPEH